VGTTETLVTAPQINPLNPNKRGRVMKDSRIVGTIEKKYEEEVRDTLF
jgi:hypothetical protein